MTYLFNTECYSAFDTTFNEAEYQQPQTHQAFCHFKNEMGSTEILDINAVAAKCYSIVKEESEAQRIKRERFEKRKALGRKNRGGLDKMVIIKGKGVPAAQQKLHLTNDLYKRIITGEIFEDYLEDGKVNPKYTCEYSNISNKQAKLKNIKVKKNYVSLVDIKNFYGDDGIEYAVFGSKKHLDSVE